MLYAHTNVDGSYQSDIQQNAVETTDELVRLLSDIDLLVLDDMGVENTEHTLNKLFSIVDNRVGKTTSLQLTLVIKN